MELSDLSNDELGHRGESFFDEICSTTKMVVNRSERDRTGWDRLLEFPYNNTEAVSFDQRRNPTSCKIQVKSTRTNTDLIRFRLSSLERLAKDPEPAFVCIFMFDNELRCTKGYLIHLLGKNLALVLKKLRREAAAGTVAVNKKEMALSIRKTANAFEPNGKGLYQALLDSIGHEPDKYIKDKLNQLENFGFEDIVATIDVEFRASKEYIAEAMLGYGGSLEVAQFGAFERRFGIDLPMTRISAPATLKITPVPFDTCLVTLTHKDLGYSVSLEASMYGIPPELAPMLGGLQMRLDTGLVDIRFKDKRCSVLAKEAKEIGYKATLRDWLKHFKVLQIMCKGGFYMELRRKGRRKVKEFMPGSLVGPSYSHVVSALKATENLLRLVDLTGFELHSKLSIDYLMVNEQNIEMASSLCLRSEGRDQITIDCNFSRSEMIVDGTPGKLITFIALDEKLIVLTIPVRSCDFVSNPRAIVDVPSGEVIDIDLIDIEDYDNYVDEVRNNLDEKLLMHRTLDR